MLPGLRQWPRWPLWWAPGCGVAASGSYSTGQVEDQVLPVAQPVLDVVTKDPQVERITRNVHDAAVNEHGDKHSGPG